jgi:hypothetical protein
MGEKTTRVMKNVIPWPLGVWCADKKRKEGLGFLILKSTMRGYFLNIFTNSTTRWALLGCICYRIPIILVEFPMPWTQWDPSGGKLFVS